MLQNEIGEDNDNDGFIIPATPITPGPGGSPTSPVSPRGARHRSFSTSAPRRDRSELDGDRSISYSLFLSRYWNRFPQSITRVLGVYMTHFPCSPHNFRGRSRFGFRRNIRSDQRFRTNHWHATEVFGSGCLLIQQLSRDVLSREGHRIRPFHCIHQAQASTSGI
jgi:hypothetical protein